MAGLQLRRNLPAADRVLSDLLCSGGDDRIAADAESAANPYGCRPWPDGRIAAFGSSTASTVSAHGYAAASRLAGSLSTDPRGVDERGAEAFERMRRELIDLCGLAAIAPEVVFAASGTDIHMLAAALVSSGGEPLTTVVAGPTETGRGVPSALTLRHFSATAASGAAVTLGAAMAGSEASELLTVPIRDLQGGLRPSDEVDRDVEAAVVRAQAQGRRILLVLVDVSKTGVVAPSPACAGRLAQGFPGRVDVLVDGCQFRLSGPRLSAYLADGFLVAVTGSKFLTGPAFSGALMIPRETAARLRHRPLSADAALYSGRSEWPGGWAARTGLSARCNLGLLLRWEAALEELRRFSALPPERVADVFRRVSEAVQARLAADRVFEPLPPADLDRGRPTTDGDWDRVPTIFPFLLRHSAPRTFREPFSVEETTRVHRLLRSAAGASAPVELGQPVVIGERDGQPIAALRLCASARLAVAALAPGGDGTDGVIGAALSALNRTALVARAVSQGLA